MNQALRTRIALVFSMIALVGCRAARSSSNSSVAAEATPAPAATMAATANAEPAPGQTGAPSAAPTRSLIVTMELALVVDDIDRAVGKARATVERAGGYVGDAKASGEGANRHAHLVLRVPTNQAHDVRGMLGALGTLGSESESAVDVTEQHADLEARLGNARVQEKRILDIMKSGSGTLSEVLATEAELARVRGTIESLEAQQRTLDHKIDLATVQLDLSLPAATPTRPPAVEDTPVASIVGAAQGGLHGAYVALLYLAMALAAALPFLLPLAAFGYGLVRLVRARRRSPALHG